MAAVVQKGLIFGLASIGQYLLPLMCLVAAAMSAWRRKQRQALVKGVVQAQDVAVLGDISWREFELLVGEAYRCRAFASSSWAATGPMAAWTWCCSRAAKNSRAVQAVEGPACGRCHCA
ncbi:hypothetical protein ACFODQ_01820 [Comamonas sp. JC664]